MKRIRWTCTHCHHRNHSPITQPCRHCGLVHELYIRAMAERAFADYDRQLAGRDKRPKGAVPLCAVCSEPCHVEGECARHIHVKVLPDTSHVYHDQYVEICSRACLVQWALVGLDMKEESEWDQKQTLDNVRDWLEVMDAPP